MVKKWKVDKLKVSEAVDDLQINLEDETDPEERASIREHIEIGQKLLKQIGEALPY